MKLRNFLYLNTKVLEDYISAIEGYIYDQESQEISNSSENAVAGNVSVRMVGGNGGHTNKKSEEIKRSVKISDAAKFEKVYKYLQSGDEDDELKYYEFLTEETYNSIARDDFIEVLVTARFSKVKELTDSVKKIADLATVIQGLTDQSILDKKASDTINGFAAIGKLNSKKEISCVFNFDDGSYPLVAYLNEDYFRCEQSSFVGQSYMLCKVIRKIPKGQNIKLDEIFEELKNMPLNREQRRSLPKNIDNPDIIKDVIKGPAFVVLPIAVYQ